VSKSSLEPNAEYTTLVDILLWRALHQPNRRAYTFLVDGETEEAHLTYGELDCKARAIGSLLQDLEASGERVLLLYPPGLGYIAAFFGCMYAGAVAVPAYPVDPARPRRTLPRLRAIVGSAQAQVALTASEVLPTVRPLFKRDRGLECVELLAVDCDAVGMENEWQPLEMTDDSLAFLMYTSGSTSTPKGSMITHRNALYNLAMFPGFKERPCTGFVSWLPLFHDLGVFFGVLHPLFRGVPAILMSSASFVQRPFRWLWAISRYGATTTGGPNFAFELCARKTTPEERARLDLSSWNMALNGAEPVRPKTLERFVEAFEPCGFRRETFYPSYGLAEASATVSGGVENVRPVVCNLERESLARGRVVEASDDYENPRALVGCGRSVAGQEIVIVDPDTLTRCPPDQVGEIWVSGPSISVGYWGRPEETERVLQACLADTGEACFLRTGDLGFLRRGELFIAGRLKDLIIIRGANHYPEDIELTVERGHRAVRAGCVAAFSVDVDTEERLVVLSEVRTSPQLNTDEVIGDIRQRIAEYHDISVHAIALIRPGTILKTSSGKIRRRACRAEFLAGNLDLVEEWRANTPTRSRASAERRRILQSREMGSVLPGSGALATDKPQTVAAIETWLVSHLAAELGIESRDIDVQQPFARYGLASSEAIHLVRALEEWTGRSLSPTLVWEYPTIESVARHLAENTADESAFVEAERVSRDDTEPIAIVGMACRFPGASSLDAFWDLLCEGRDAVAEVPQDRWDVHTLYDPDPTVPGKMISRWGGFLEGFREFDAEFFGISPREAPHLDPRQRLALEIAWEALEDAGIPPHSLAGSRTGVFVAVLANDYEIMLFDDLAQVDAYSGVGSANSVVANRLSYFFDLQGPSLTVDTACSGSLTAIHLASQSLRSGESSLALAGGVNVNLLPKGNVFFSKAGVISPDGRCKPFDAGANGIVRSDGAGIIVLKLLSRALADGDRIYAVIQGSAINSDGRSNGIMAPNRWAQEAVLREAYRLAGIAPRQAQYVEAHGTGTSLGDPIEVQALATVLGADRAPGDRCALGSLKSNVGHLEPAAGVASVIKAALSINRRLIPPSIHFDQPNPLIPFQELGLFVQQTLGAWPRDSEPLVAGVSSFGFGGANAHLVLREPPRSPEVETGAAPQVYLLPLSARNQEALDSLARAWRQFVATDDAATPLEDVCYTASVRRTHLESRAAFTARSREDLEQQLDTYLQEQQRPARRRIPGRQRELVFVFSGQGSHWSGMGRQLLDREPVFRAALEECDRILRQHVEWSLLEEMAADEAASRLNDTEIAQPAIFSIQVALAALWRSWGIEPDAIVGQSLGEAAAAHVCGALSLEDGMRVVFHRSRLMKSLVGQGKTAVVGLTPEQARLVLVGFEDALSIAGANSPTSCVVSGEPQALERLLKSLDRREVFCRMLRGVDIAFHGAEMDPLGKELAEALDGLQVRPTELPVFSAVTGDLLKDNLFDAAHWERNLTHPFLFADAIERLVETGYDTFLELSPHPVLSKAILEGLHHLGREGVVLPSLRRGRDEREEMLTSLSELYSMGWSVDWHRLYPNDGRVVSLPTYPWQRERYWLDQLGDGAQARMVKQGRTHPLLGEHLESASAPGRHFWELDLGAHSLHYLDEHRVQGAIVLPGAAYLEMVLAAAGQVLDEDALMVEDVTFDKALFLPETGGRRVQVVLSSERPEGISCQVFGRSINMEEQDAWLLHAHGKLRRVERQDASNDPAHASPDEIQARCVEEVSGARHYRAMQERGLEYGPSFQAVARIWRRDGEALAQLQLPSNVRGETGAYCIHPVLLDAGFQVVAAAVPAVEQGGRDDNLYLPVGVGRLRLYRRPGDRVWCHASLRARDETSPDGLAADVRLFDETGQTLAEVTGLRLQRLGSIQSVVAQDVSGWFYALDWQPKARSGQRSTGQDRITHWLVLADSGGIGDRLAHLMEKQGQTCVLASIGQEFSVVERGRRYTLNPADPEGAKRLLHDLHREIQPGHLGVVYLWGLDVTPVEKTTVASLEADRTLACDGVVHLAQALADLAQPARLWLATRGAQAVGGESAVEASQALIWGLGRVVAVEHSELWGGLVDLDPATSPDESASLLSGELGDPGKERQLAFRDGQRYVARIVRHDDRSATMRPIGFRTDASYLITGGLGGLGLEVARWMAEQGARRLILMGRSELPARSEWAEVEEGTICADRIAAIRELEGLGASVRLAAVDVTDEARLAAFLKEYERESWPPIRGVIHAAGLTRDQLLVRMDMADFSAVLRPKVWGAWLLHSLLAEAPLDFFVLFSSVASVLGSFGQANYAAANAFMDSLAHHRRARDLPAQSVNWGPWAQVGMAARAGLREQHEQQGLHPIEPERGTEALGQLLQRDTGQTIVIAVDWRRWLGSMPAGGASSLASDLAQGQVVSDAPAGRSQEEKDFVRDLLTIPDQSERQSLLESHMQDLAAGVLRIKRARMNPHKSLNAFGLDSIMAVELKNRAEAALGVSLTISDLLKGSSIAHLADQVMSQLEEDGEEHVG